MRYSIAAHLSKIADLIEKDDTPVTEEEVKVRKKRQDHPGEGESAKNTKTEPSKVKKTSLPKIKPPRRLPEYKKKWNEENKTEKMRDYMKDYRSENKDKVTDSPKSKYVKKPQG